MSKYVIIDLEMCRLPRGWRSAEYTHGYEIIQLGAVLLDEEFQIVDQFDSYVKPTYGTIDSFIRRLTGITGNDVKEAPELAVVMEQFIKWLPEDAVPVSWSDTDKIQLQYEITAKHISMDGLEEFFDSWVDCQKIFDEKIDAASSRPCSLSYALLIADIPYQEGAHNGLVDAWNTALLYAKMQKEPELLLNSYYLEARKENHTGLTSSLGDLLSKLQISVQT